MFVKTHELTAAVNVLLLLQSCILVASRSSTSAIGAFVWIVDGSSYVATCSLLRVRGEKHRVRGQALID